ncbi:MAG: hypothetical protein ACI977_000054 [Candidatus Nanohaloarchaea archaeon]|jgi:uncharacterized protein YoxC
MRDLEEKIRNLTARVNTLDDTIMNKTKTLNTDLQEFEDDLSEVRDRIANLEVDVKEINREKRKFVSKQELEEMENYMDLMNPVNSNFTTEKQVEQKIDDKALNKDEVESLIEKKLN